jgi:hypothetical protein
MVLTNLIAPEQFAIRTGRFCAFDAGVTAIEGRIDANAKALQLYRIDNSQQEN